MTSLGQLAAGERRDLADFLESLSPAEWSQPSLCTGWSVHDVGAHVPSYDVLGWGGTIGHLARSGFSLSRANRSMVARLRGLDPGEVVDRLRTHAEPRGVTAMFGGAIGLLDSVVHHQDVRRALGAPREVPADRLVAALEFAPRARALPAPANIRGLQAVATDVDWSHGDGEEVRGPGEALLMALAGRPQALPELEGPGADVLRSRVLG